MPILVLSSIDNAKLASRYLSPSQFIETNLSNGEVTRYLRAIAKEVKKEIEEHNVYLLNKDKFQIPTHAYSFEPETLGVEPKDLWDSIGVITKLAIDNNDYPVFRQSLKAILVLVKASYDFKADAQDKNNFRITDGIATVARKRFKSVINSIVDSDKNGVFLQSLSSELCTFLVKDEVLSKR